MIKTTIIHAIGKEPVKIELSININFGIGQEVYFTKYNDDLEVLQESKNPIASCVEITEFNIKVMKENDKPILFITFEGVEIETGRVLQCEQRDVFAKREDAKERLLEIAKGLIEFK